MDMLAEVLGKAQQLGLLPDVDFVRAAGEVELESAALKIFEQTMGFINDKMLLVQPAGSNALNARSDAFIQAAQIFLFVPKWVFGLATALPDALGQLNHLINGLFAVQPHDVVKHELANLPL